MNSGDSQSTVILWLLGLCGKRVVECEQWVEYNVMGFYSVALRMGENSKTGLLDQLWHMAQ